jgi:hypothetical protein
MNVINEKARCTTNRHCNFTPTLVCYLHRQLQALQKIIRDETSTGARHGPDLANCCSKDMDVDAGATLGTGTA